MPTQETKGVVSVDIWLMVSLFLIGFSLLLLGGMYLEQYLLRKHRNKHAH